MAEQCWTDWWWFWMMLGGWSHSAIRWNRSHEQVMPGYFRNHQHQPENCFFPPDFLAAVTKEKRGAFKHLPYPTHIWSPLIKASAAVLQQVLGDEFPASQHLGGWVENSRAFHLTSWWMDGWVERPSASRYLHTLRESPEVADVATKKSQKRWCWLPGNEIWRPVVWRGVLFCILECSMSKKTWVYEMTRVA